MIVVMQSDCTEADIQKLEEHLRERGLEGQINRGVERTVIGVLGQTYPELRDELELLRCVREMRTPTRTPLRSPSSNRSSGSV